MTGADCDGGADAEADEDVDAETDARRDCVRAPLTDALAQSEVVSVGRTVNEGLTDVSAVAVSDREVADETLGAMEIDESSVPFADADADGDARLEGEPALGVASTVTEFDAVAHGDARGEPVASAVTLADCVRPDDGVFKTDCEPVADALVEPERDAVASDVLVDTDVSDRAAEVDGDTVVENDWPDIDARALSDEFGDAESPEVDVGVEDSVEEVLAHFDTDALVKEDAEFDARALVVPLCVDKAVVDMLCDSDVEGRALFEAGGVAETDAEPEVDGDTVGEFVAERDGCSDADATPLRVETSDGVSDVEGVGVASADIERAGLEERAGDADSLADECEVGDDIADSELTGEPE